MICKQDLNKAIFLSISHELESNQYIDERN